jgi:2-polyprenyl-6-methoxyphenol hydroxylase-like FAD-dependent oxidoreductase
MTRLRVSASNTSVMELKGSLARAAPKGDGALRGGRSAGHPAPREERAMTVLIAGGGIAGLTLALTCRQIGIDAKVFEAVREPRPLGVGINLQPNAVRELDELGLMEMLPEIGIATREWGLFSTRGLEIWAEPRGREAGYRWPQFSVHRGELQMRLLAAARARLGSEAVVTGARVAGWEAAENGVAVRLETDEGERVEHGRVLIGADGLHSAVRARLWPGEGAPVWSGAVLWRGVSPGRPFRTGASMALIGSMDQRFVSYPISTPDPVTGEARMNWIAELKFDPAGGWAKESWTTRAGAEDFLPRFVDWRFGWIDVPAMVARAETIWEYPMVDRDPLPRWTFGPVTLMGDAAHVMWPVGSNGASQAIMDARKLGAAFLEHGVGAAALKAYEAEQRPAAERMIRATRAAEGPDALLGVVEARCGGAFDDVEDVIPRAEMDAFQARWKATAGLAREALNEAAPLIPPRGRAAADARPAG